MKSHFPAQDLIPYRMRIAPKHVLIRTNTFPCKFSLRWFCIRSEWKTTLRSLGTSLDEATSPAIPLNVAIDVGGPGSPGIGCAGQLSLDCLPLEWSRVEGEQRRTERIRNSFRIILLMSPHYYLLFLLFEYAARCVLGRGNVNKSPVLGEFLSIL